MTALRKKSNPRPISATQRALHCVAGGQRRNRPNQHGADELRLLRIERGKERCRQGRIGVTLEPPVRHFANPIVSIGEQRPHQIRSAAIVERRQNDQCTITNELVRVAANGPGKHGHNAGSRRPAQLPRGGRTGGIVEVGKAVDRSLQLSRKRALPRGMNRCHNEQDDCDRQARPHGAQLAIESFSSDGRTTSVVP